MNSSVRTDLDGQVPTHILIRLEGEACRMRLLLDFCGGVRSASSIPPHTTQDDMSDIEHHTPDDCDAQNAEKGFGE